LPDVVISAHPTHTEITDPLIYFEDRGSNHISGIWNFDDGQTQASNFNTINHIYSDTGIYQVTLTTISIDGCENTAYQTIIISPTFTIYIPNAFTPNNDLDNDYFMPILEGVQEFEMSIYNRLGQKIFQTTEYSNEYCIRGCDATWDGTVNNGEYCTIGVYIYHLIITDINGKVRNFEGPITLIR
jgi:gliding motility-associated-like protein